MRRLLEESGNLCTPFRGLFQLLYQGLCQNHYTIAVKAHTFFFMGEAAPFLGILLGLGVEDGGCVAFLFDELTGGDAVESTVRG